MVVFFQQKLEEVKAKSLPVSVKTVNSSEKKDKEMTTFIFIDTAEIKTLHLFMFPATQSRKT